MERLIEPQLQKLQQKTKYLKEIQPQQANYRQRNPSNSKEISWQSNQSAPCSMKQKTSLHDIGIIKIIFDQKRKRKQQS